ncbi:MAG: PspA/IM30 family protein [Clostridium sp.]|nr:PspA/IM30 family protein [Clostridium sp.]MCM1547876.1 PspA/IM30 family protein [Ruminococcus sp.]
MGIFSRIGDLLKSNINDLIDKAEDPEKMVKQIIIDMQEELNKSTQALGKAVSSERIAKKQYDDSARKSAEWENRAKTALAAGDETLAKKALENKVKADKETVQYKEMYDTISQQTETIRTQVDVLKSKLEEAKSRQAMLIARSQMADTQKNLAKATGGFDTSSASDKFDRMEEKIMQKEAEAQAFAEIAGQDNSLADDFEALENNSKVDSELERLKAEMGM